MATLSNTSTKLVSIATRCSKDTPPICTYLECIDMLKTNSNKYTTASISFSVCLHVVHPRLHGSRQTDRQMDLDTLQTQ